MKRHQASSDIEEVITPAKAKSKTQKGVTGKKKNPHKNGIKMFVNIVSESRDNAVLGRILRKESSQSKFTSIGTQKSGTGRVRSEAMVLRKTEEDRT